MEVQTIHLDQEEAEALFTLLGITEAEGPLQRVFNHLSRVVDETRFQINEPDDTLRLWAVK